MPVNGYHPIALRVQALALLTEGISQARVAEITQIPKSTLKSIKRRARERGFNPAVDPRIKDDFVKDAQRSGRPKEITEETENRLIENVCQNRNGREKS